MLPMRSHQSQWDKAATLESLLDCLFGLRGPTDKQRDKIARLRGPWATKTASTTKTASVTKTASASFFHSALHSFPVSASSTFTERHAPCSFFPKRFIALPHEPPSHHNILFFKRLGCLNLREDRAWKFEGATFEGNVTLCHTCRVRD